MQPKLGSIIKKPMELALSLAEKGKYTVSPNPIVGAVLLKEKKLVGYGYHLYKGDKHAEVKAIEMTNGNSVGSALYINLEPCCHYGQTPPCVDKVIEAGIKEVHVATIDPNPLVSGTSIKKLQSAGIKTFIGECGNEARRLNEIFFHYMCKGTPFVIAKWAMSFDGKIATENFDSKWISGIESREHAHLLRNSVDAILVGTNTARYDNPHLTVRNSKLSYVRKPFKIVIDKNGVLEERLNIFQEESKLSFIVSTSKYPKAKRMALESKGVNFIEIKEVDGILDLQRLLKELGELSVTSLLIEGGAKTLAEFLKENLVNKFYCYMSPKVIGGRSSITPFGSDIGVDFVNESRQAKFETIEKIGDDFLISATVK